MVESTMGQDIALGRLSLHGELGGAMEEGQRGPNNLHGRFAGTLGATGTEEKGFMVNGVFIPKTLTNNDIQRWVDACDEV
jgi:hypothetical protein